MQVSEKLMHQAVSAGHSPELMELLYEIGHACERPASGYPSLPISQFLYLCRYPDGYDKRPKPINQKFCPNPIVLGTKVSKHKNTEVFQLIDELAQQRGESAELHLNSSVVAALNKLLVAAKNKKRR